MKRKPTGHKYRNLSARGDSMTAAGRRVALREVAAQKKKAGLEKLWLYPIPLVLRAGAIESLAAGSAIGFLCKAGNTHGLELVVRNVAALVERGIYEAALLQAYKMTRTNWSGWSIELLSALFGRADLGALRKAGDPMPDGDHFTLYRGVSGREPRRKEAGYSWTRSPSVAAWFANRFQALGAPRFEDPAVLVTQVKSQDVLAYLNGRSEDDFIVLARNWSRVEPMPMVEQPAKEE